MRCASAMKRLATGMFALMISALGCSDTVGIGPTEDASTTQDGSTTPDGAMDAGVDASGPCVFPTGQTCARGATCPDPDGCNTCMCMADGRLGCTARACIDGGPTQDVPPAQDRPDTDVPGLDAATVPCTVGSICPSGTRCVFIAGLCGDGARGTCQNTAGCESLPVAPEYCGCDGTTFVIPSACPPERPYASAGACPSVDGGVSTDAPTADVSTPDGGRPYATARMTWEAPGGFAGTGPAVEVLGDGTVNVWRSTRGFGTTMPEPDETLHVSLPAVDDLFSKWEAVALDRLPHGPMRSADCYPRAAVTLCERCDVRELRYQHPDQLSPEMADVWAWFMVNTPETLPSTFCAR